jgi:hypothetical protein
MDLCGLSQSLQTAGIAATQIYHDRFLPYALNLIIHNHPNNDQRYRGIIVTMF